MNEWKNIIRLKLSAWTHFVYRLLNTTSIQYRELLFCSPLNQAKNDSVKFCLLGKEQKRVSTSCHSLHLRDIPLQSKRRSLWKPFLLSAPHILLRLLVVFNISANFFMRSFCFHIFLSLSTFTHSRACIYFPLKKAIQARTYHRYHGISSV